MKDWPKIRLGDLLTESKIESKFPDSRRRIRVKLNILGVDQRPDSKDKHGATKYFTRQSGQFIYGKQNLHKGAFGIIPEELDGFESSSDLPAFDVNEICYPEWIFYFFKQGNFYLKLEVLAKGIGSKRIQPQQLYELQISIPPKDEQHRILELISVFEKRHLQLSKEIDRQFDLIIKLRDSILIEGLNGKLTSEWRKKNKNIEPATALLKKIIEQRTQLNKGRKIRKEQRLLKLSKNDIADVVPQGWIFCRLGDYAYSERGRFSARPRNDPRYFNGNIPFIQIGDLPPNGGIISYHKQTLNDLGLTVSKLFPKGTVVIAIVGATIGNSGILDYDMCFPDSIIGIKPNNYVNTKFLEYFLRSKKEYFRSVAYSGGGQPNIKLPTINNCILLLPPAEEQIEIVERISAINIHCENLLERINQQKQDSGNLVASALSSIWGPQSEFPLILSEPKVESGGSTFQRLLDTLNNYEKNNVFMELEQLLKENGKMSAVSLWQLSTYHENIDAFYEKLKEQIEEKKTIKESDDKGYLELA